MTRHLPPLNALRVFEAAARLGSVQKSADELCVTPGAVSRQIKKLESWLGTELFHRGQHQLIMTPKADAYRTAIADALDRIDNATERLTSDARGSPLRIACFPTFAFRWLIPRLGRFHDRHPGIDVQLTTSLAAIDFDRDRFDVAIRVGHGDWDGCHALRLADIRYFPVCSPKLPSLRSIRTPADLGAQKLLHAQPSPGDWKHWLGSIGLDGLTIGSGNSFESLNLAYQAAIEGIGIAMGIEVLVEEDIRRGRLVRLFDIHRQSSRSFHLIWPKKRDDDQKIRALTRWLKDEVSGENQMIEPDRSGAADKSRAAARGPAVKPRSRTKSAKASVTTK